MALLARLSRDYKAGTPPILKSGDSMMGRSAQSAIESDIPPWITPSDSDPLVSMP